MCCVIRLRCTICVVLYNVGCVPQYVLCSTVVLCHTIYVVLYNVCCVLQYVLCYTIVFYHTCCVLPYMCCCTMCVVFYNCVLQYVLCCIIVLCCTIYVMITKLSKAKLVKFIKYCPMQHKLHIRQHNMLLIYQYYYDGCINKSVYVACCAT